MDRDQIRDALINEIQLTHMTCHDFKIFISHICSTIHGEWSPYGEDDYERDYLAWRKLGEIISLL